ncbi:MAG TPA: hypothetical protein DCG28_03345 [Lachnospiraceae bacterium]|nr:hypothetical protein [Lachnospiraceae bacterium]
MKKALFITIAALTVMTACSSATSSSGSQETTADAAYADGSTSQGSLTILKSVNTEDVLKYIKEDSVTDTEAGKYHIVGIFREKDDEALRLEDAKSNFVALKYDSSVDLSELKDGDNIKVVFSCTDINALQSIEDIKVESVTKL